MANHVHSVVELHEANLKAKEFFARFTSYLDADNEEADEHALKYLFGEWKNERGWYIDNIGAKWMNFEDWYEDYFATTTAWSPPSELFEALYQKLFELDPNVKMSMVYEDEMPNFLGYCAYSGEYSDSEHFDDDDYGDIVEGWKLYEEFDEDDDDGYHDQMEDLYNMWAEKSQEWITEFFEEE